MAVKDALEQIEVLGNLAQSMLDELALLAAAITEAQAEIRA